MKKERNIYLFTNSFPYGKGESFLANELKNLVDEFQRVIIIPLQSDKGIREIPKNIEVLKPLYSFDTKKCRLRFIYTGIFNFSPFSFALKELRMNKPYTNYLKFWEFMTFLLRFRSALHHLHISPGSQDVLYFYWGNTSVILAPILKSKFHCSIAVRFHGSDLYEEAKVGYIPFRQYVFPAIDQFITVSEFGRRYLLSRYPEWLNEKKVVVSRLGVFDRGINNKQSDGLGIFHLVSCSNLIELKRIDLIIKALQLIDFKIKWTHFGDGPLKTILENQSNVLRPNVEVNWKGHRSNEELIRFYQVTHVDLFLNVSASEGIPVSIMEAMSFGIPAMATNVGGVSELVDEFNGVLLPADLDEKMLANAIISFAVSNCNKKRESAREFWNQHFNADTNYKRLVQIIKEL